MNRCAHCPYPDTCSYFDECSFIVKSRADPGDLVWSVSGYSYIVAKHEFAIAKLQEDRMVDFKKINDERKRKAKPAEQEAIAKRAATMPFVDSKTPHITAFPDLVDILPDLAIEYRNLSEQIAPLDARKKELGAEISALLDAVGVKSIRGDGWLALRIEDSFTETLSKEKLLALGVTMEQIEAGIVKSPKKGYGQVRKGSEDAS